jgi:transposase
MIIIGVDFHPEFQQIAWVDTDTGEFQERKLRHRAEAEMFYRELAVRGVGVRIGMEASGHARWLERLLAELQFELWIGDAAEIRAKRVRKQKTDRQDAQLILKLLLEDRFPRHQALCLRTLLHFLVDGLVLDSPQATLLPLFLGCFRKTLSMCACSAASIFLFASSKLLPRTVSDSSSQSVQKLQSFGTLADTFSFTAWAVIVATPFGDSHWIST